MRVAAKCPSCGAGLDIDDRDDVAKCSYCGTTSYLQRADAPPPPAGAMVIDLAALHAQHLNVAHETIQLAEQQQRVEQDQNVKIGIAIASVVGVVSIVSMVGFVVIVILAALFAD